MLSLPQFPTVALGPLPTPLDEAPRLADALGLARVLVKRDDLSGLALGGNKVRKLEYVIGDALASGADTIITATGPQSNRARMTAAACRKAGLACVLLLGGEYGSRDPVGNLMLDEVLGAELHFLPQGDSYSAAALARAQDIAADLRRRGRTPYITEVGGLPEPLSDFGYFMGGIELVRQCRERGVDPGTVLVAVGSGGTQAGVLVALRAEGCAARVVGVSTDPGATARAQRVARHAAGLIDWLGLDVRLAADDVNVVDDVSASGHGTPDRACVEAVRLAARTEGLIVDPTYVGKVIAAVPGLLAQRLIEADRPVVLLHTGGTVSLFLHAATVAAMAEAF